jgi:hypothetical protein
MMRVSVKKNDSGYRPDYRYYEVFLDGQKLDNCFTADEERGEVWVHPKDEHGRFLRAADDKLTEECLRGQVTIVRKADV